jgi:hypothetical protein
VRRAVRPAPKRVRVLIRLEADEQPAAHVEHRPLDHRRLVKHQRDHLLLCEPLFVVLGKLAERGAGAIEQRFPAGLARPALESSTLDAGALVVVEGVGDAAVVEPGPRLLHGVAVLDAVDGDGLRHMRLVPIV